VFRTRAKQPALVNARVTVSIARPPETVMDFLLDPVSGVLTGLSTVRCLHVPDTPERAPGAQFVNLSLEGGLLVADVDELVELDHPHRAVSVNRSTPGAITVAYTCVARDDGGTDYTQEVWMHPDAGRAKALQALFEAETARSVHRIKQVLEGDEWTPPGR
jgi:hypothetical protein